MTNAEVPEKLKEASALVRHIVEKAAQVQAPVGMYWMLGMLKEFALSGLIWYWPLLSLSLCTHSFLLLTNRLNLRILNYANHNR